MSEPRPEITRRRLLVVGGASATVACGADPQPMQPRADAAPEAAEASADVPVAPRDADEPLLGLDGGVASPEQGGWRPPGGGVDVGAVADFPMGSWRMNAGARAIVARDAMGLYAYSALCTHERCLVSEPDAMGTTECTCHGSRFDGVGRATRGPATVPLRHVAVSIVGGRVFVDPATRVLDTATRVPVPDLDAGAGDAGDASDAADVPRDTSRPDIDPCTLGEDVGPTSMFNAGSWTLLRDQRLVVGRDARGMFAFTAVCPHQECVVQPPDAMGSISCRCHGSRFDGDGRVVQGPAAGELDNFRVRICAGRVRVDRASPVNVGTRTPVT